MADQIARQDAPREQTWDLTDLFPDRTDWQRGCDAVRASVPTVTVFRGRVGESASSLLQALAADERLTEELNKVTAFAVLRSAVDQADSERQGDMGRVLRLASEVERERTFLADEILALPEGTVPSYLRQEPELELYRRRLERILRDQPYRLQPQTEAVLASFGQTFAAPYLLYQQAAGADARFAPATDAHGASHAVSVGRWLFGFAPSPDNRLRREAYRSVAHGFLPYRSTLATNLATFVGSGVVEAQVRGFPSAIDMELHRQEVPREAFDTIVDTISQGLAPPMRRYARLQQRLLGVERARLADLDAAWPGPQPALAFEDARRSIVAAAAPMGEAYRSILERAFAERWIDWADHAGRRGGAFCNAVYGVHPYVFSSWTGSLRGAFVLAHELGHAVHGQLAMERNPLGRTKPTLYAVEGPSTFNELLLADHLLASSDDAAHRRRVIKTHMATFQRNFVLHLQKAQLQRRIYALAEAGEAITADVLDREQMAILEDYWGDSVELIDEDRTVWMQEAHYYMGMYPYTYSAGLSAAVAMFAAVQAEGSAAVERWLEFLRAGGSAGPLELFAAAGIDMTQAATLERAVAHVSSLVDELEQEPQPG